MGNINIFNFENNNNFIIEIWDRILSIFNHREKYTKDSVHILFIDDSDMPVVSSLKKAQYKVKKINDINDIDDPEIKNSQIIFVDFDGVGRIISPQHQGAGLIKELKAKYGATKYVVLYTAQITLPSDTTMNSLFNIADDKMRKDSDVTDFTEQIRKAIKKLK